MQHKLVIKYLPVIIPDKRKKRVVNRWLQDNLVPGPGKGPDGKMDGGYDPGSENDPFFFHLPLVPSPVPAGDRLIKPLITESITEDLMPCPVPDSLHNKIRGPEIHICHPHGDKVPAAEIIKAMVKFDGAGMLSRDELIEIISHIISSGFWDYKTNIVILTYPGKPSDKKCALIRLLAKNLFI
jgi:hypothetical protein